MGIVFTVIGIVVVVLVLLSIAGALLGAGAGALWWFTGLYHAFKPEGPQRSVDASWGRDQGREAGGKDDPPRPSGS